MLAISVDPPSESQQMSQFLGGALPLLGDPDLKVIKAYGMEMQGGGMAAMGYVVVDAQGRIAERLLDPSFGQHWQSVLSSLQRA